MILEWLERAATDRPDHPFIVEAEATRSLGEIAAMVEATTRRHGPGDIVDLQMKPSAETVVRLLALWQSAAVVRPVPKGTVTGEDTSGYSPEPGDALVMATSGSSGRPKLVRLTFENLAASAAASARHLDHSPDERWLCNLPLHHIGGLSIILRSLREMTTVILEPGFDASRTASLLTSGEVTIASLVPTTLHRTLDAATGSVWACRAVLVGGGPLPQSLLDRALDAEVPALPTYGMTETASQVATAVDPGGPLVALSGVDLRISDNDVIEVKGSMVSPGYLGEPQRTGDWLTTSDTGRIDDGHLTVTGRLDHVIITGGEKVNPEAVEAVLEALPGVDAACVIGLPDADWGQRVVAVYEGAAPSGEELGSAATQLLARHEVPTHWIRVGRLPRTGIGKIDRVAVHEVANAH